MGNYVDLTGQVFGRLTVIGTDGEKKHGSYMWNCICSCGKECQASSNQLRCSRKKSCGCLNDDTRKGNFLNNNYARIYEDYSVDLYKKFYTSYKARAKQRGQPFEITREEFIDMIQLPCGYCGLAGEDKYVLSGSGYKYKLFGNGIDRIDSSVGYVKSNCVPCCKTCNIAKNSLSDEEFKSWIDRVYLYQHNEQNLLTGVV
jgi:hypothetical protein